MSEPRALVALLVAAVFLLGWRVYHDHTEDGRRGALRLYRARAYILPWRLGPAMAPLVAAACLSLIPFLLLPLPARYLGFAPASALFAAAWFAAYARQDWILPAWMRREVEEGRLERAAPDRGDWLIFWLVAPFMAVSPIGAIVLGLGLAR